jgi:predicted metalloprotease with PDZ domain
MQPAIDNGEMPDAAADETEAGIPSAAIELTLTRAAHGKLGMHVLNETNVVESVARGGAAAGAGVMPGDQVVGVQRRYLSHFQCFADLLPAGRLGDELVLHILRTTAPAAQLSAAAVGSSEGQRPVRKRARTAAEGMVSLDNVRLGDGLSRTRMARMARAFEQNSANAL